MARVFSRSALEAYLPQLQDVIRSEVVKWCEAPRGGAAAAAVDVYAAAKQLTFRLAVGVLLGLRLDEERLLYLARTFEQLMDNLFSLPVDAPFSGLRKVGGACGVDSGGRGLGLRGGVSFLKIFESFT